MSGGLERRIGRPPPIGGRISCSNTISRNSGQARPYPPARRRLWVLLAALPALVLPACATRPVDPYLPATPPMVLATPAESGVRDLRAAYREAVCRRLAPDGPACPDVLLRISGESDMPPAPPDTDFAAHYRIGFVPGFLAECFDAFGHTFADAERALSSRGFDVHHLRVAGRGSTAQNAAVLAEQIADLEPDPRPLVLITHSKGLLDVLEYVLRNPTGTPPIAAIVSVAGAANGSPLADQLLSYYQDWIAKIPLPGCEAGVGQEIQDLRRDVRLAWWQRNGAALNVPVFSLVATPRPNRVSPGQLKTYRSLARIEPRNDGKLLWYDQIVPGGYLLGYVNADHWTVAIPVAEELPALARWFPLDVPRVVLVDAAIEIVGRTLADAPAP
jgi:hypothetical protein